MLTREEIAEIPAGPKMDELIAASLRPKPTGPPSYREEGKADGPWKVVHVGAGVLEWRATPNYSTEIAHAWALFAGKGWLLYENNWNDANPWFVFADMRALEDWLPLGCAPTAELAICRAALAARFLATPPASPNP